MLAQSDVWNETLSREAKESGTEILQETVDVFAAQEKHFREEAARLDVGEIPETDLCLSPLVMESRFLIKDILNRLDPYGSNADLIDSEAAAALQTPLFVHTSPSPSEPTLIVESATNREVPRADSEINLEDRAASREGVVDPANFQGGVSAGSEIALTDPIVLPEKVLEITDSSSPDLTGSETNESRSEALPGERTAASFGGQEQVVRVDPPASTFGRVLGPEE